MRGSNFDTIFFVDEGREGPNTIFYNRAIIGQPANAIEMAFCWLAHDGPTFNVGLRAL